MTTIHDDLLAVVSEIRTHLEYQQALGVRTIEMSEVSFVSAQKTFAPTVPDATPLKTTNAELTPLTREVSPELSGVREELGDCTRCRLSKGRKNIVFGEGNPRARIVFVGEGPGQEEDEQGRPFVGAAGQLLTDIIVKGMQLQRTDVYICNVVKCRPPENRNPEPDEIAACEPFLKKQIRTIKPLVIVALGNIAVKTLLQTKEGITSLRGKWRTYDGIPLMPTFHPAYLLRNPKDKALVWKDIQLVIAKMNQTS